MRCIWCRAALVDADGQPAWDVLSFAARLEFVCRDGCPPRPVVAPYRWPVDPRPVKTAAAPVLAGAHHG